MQGGRGVKRRILEQIEPGPFPHFPSRGPVAPVPSSHLIGEREVRQIRERDARVDLGVEIAATQDEGIEVVREDHRLGAEERDEPLL
jgi:hypothetical protein